MRVIRTVDQRLPVALTEEEINTFSRDVVALHIQADDAEKKAKDAMKEAKEGFTMLRDRAKDLSQCVKDRKEDRSVLVECRWNADTQEIWEVRTDTGEVIEKRPTRYDEQRIIDQQIPLFPAPRLAEPV